MHIVDVLVQSAAAYALALLVAAIVTVLATSTDNPSPSVAVSIYAVLSYEGTTILTFVSVRTFGVQILGNLKV